MSITGYLYQLFDSHQEISHGIFSVDNLELSSAQKQDAKICFTAWLAPFDLGVMQDTCIVFHPSHHYTDYQGILMSIRRKSGEQNTWWRINKRFVNLIRKQLLIWRSMDTDEKEDYILKEITIA